MCKRERFARLAQHGMTLIEIMIVLAILALVMGLVVGPLVMRNLEESKKDIARLAVSKLANEAYPQWRVLHPGQTCPSTIVELSAQTNSKDTEDPWGNDYTLLCPPNLPAGAKMIAIMSLGPDGKAATEDDIKSW
jgi:prepilin-type N-terminal cleavage/methylation domain-containing protein